MKRAFAWGEAAIGAAIFFAGLVLRVRLAATTYLNPDEAIHAILSEGNWRGPIAAASGLWSNSLRVTHPPLLTYITHAALMFGRSEPIPRLVPVMAGSVFPVLIYFWLRRISGTAAAMTALLLLTFAPHLVSVSAQVRGYTLAFFFLAASLVALEEALGRDRWPFMALYSALLWLCILSDYSMAFFVGAAGVYVLLRIRNNSRAVKIAWAAGQVAAAALYAVLFAAQVSTFRGGSIETGAMTGWLKGAFPHPGTMWTFPFVNTLKPFAYLMASVPAGAVALTAFAASLWFLWKKNRPLWALLVLPFLLNLAGAYSRFFPYGRTRHTLVLGLFAACGVGILVQRLPRRAAGAALGMALLVTPLWYQTADTDVQDIAAGRNQKSQMLDCLAYIHRQIPAGALFYSTAATVRELSRYEPYLESAPRKDGSRCLEHTLGPWRAATCGYGHQTREEFTAGVRAFRNQFGLAPDERVWVVDGGWDPVSRAPDPNLPFTQAVRVFEDDGR